MILFLDTTADVHLLALANIEGTLIRRKRIGRDERRGDTVFRVIDNWARKNRFSSIIVVTGPGRFSGIRHGITIANTLAFALHIPLYGIKKKDGETSQQLIARALRRRASPLFLIPHYGQEPNITIKK